MRPARGEYPCGRPGCEFVAESPGELGGHRTAHRNGGANRESWTLRIDPELRARATRFAQEKVIGPNLLVEAALRAYLDQHEDVSDWLDELALSDRSGS